MEDEVKRAGVGSGTAGPRPLTAGKLTGQKPALKMKEVWSIRTRLELEGDVRNLVLFNLAIDSKLRGCHFGQAEGWRCRGRRTREVTRRDFSEKDRQAGTVRDHGEHPTITHRAFRRPHTWCGRLSLPEPAGSIASSLDPPVRPHRSGLGGVDRAQSGDLWHALPKAHEGRPHLSQDRQPEGCPAAAGTYKA